jgi:hypothetical protein
MVEILFGLFIWNNNGDLRRTTTIQSLLWNSSYSHYFGTIYLCLDTQLLYLFREQRLFCYSASPGPSKHTRRVCLDRAKNSVRIE